MKLVNPTDDHLNAAFAEKVAGWTATAARGPLATFTRSFDAVLPWLEKWPRVRVSKFAGYWLVEVSDDPNNHSAKGAAIGKDGDVPRAAVICLLRAHGVEVVFK